MARALELVGGVGLTTASAGDDGWGRLCGWRGGLELAGVVGADDG
jgi:hypothetical protein